jgi:hypothetical protein
MSFYKVKVEQLIVNQYSVEADSKKEAIQKIKDGLGECIDDYYADDEEGFNYSAELEDEDEEE